MTGNKKNPTTASTESRSLSRIRDRQPLIHCIVNEAAISITANVLLAAGASPAMTHNPSEVQSFTASSDALSINLGMLTAGKTLAIHEAIKTALNCKIPWVLDPAMLNRSPARYAVCKTLLDYQPRVIRGNATEIDTLCRAMHLSPKELCGRYSTVIMATGEVDQIISQNRKQEMILGHKWMQCVTGMGCALSALIAAFMTEIDDSFNAAIEAVRIYGAVGQAAADRSDGPGTYVGHFLDCLYAESVFLRTDTN